MPVQVVDASALASVLFVEPEAEEVVERLRGFRIAAPLLLPFEVASVCLKKIRLYPEKKKLLVAGYKKLELMDIAKTEVAMNEVIVLADENGITVYDASYLWLACRLNVELVTLDKKLEKVALRVRRYSQ